MCAADRDELARWFARYNGDPDTFDNPDLRSHPVNVQGRRDYRRQADALLSSGVLVDAADVRARALEDAADNWPGYPLTPRETRDLLRDRAVSERDRGTT